MMDNNEPVQYIKDIDYLLHNKIIEFNRDYFEEGIMQPGQSFYGKVTKILEESLYSTYGTLIRLGDPNKYNFDNISGKAAVNTVLQSLQNLSYTDSYQKALNVYYGLPIAPTNCKVLGLYESYDYIIKSINGFDITLTLKTGFELHNFIQVGTRLRVGRTNEELIVLAINSRTTGSIKVENSFQQPMSIIVGDTVNVKLINKYKLKSVSPENGFVVYSNEDGAKIQHIINIVQSLTNGNEYPEILIYGTNKHNNTDINYDGIYHITEAQVV